MHRTSIIDPPLTELCCTLLCYAFALRNLTLECATMGDTCLQQSQATNDSPGLHNASISALLTLLLCASVLVCIRRTLRLSLPPWVT